MIFFILFIDILLQKKNSETVKIKTKMSDEKEKIVCKYNGNCVFRAQGREQSWDCKFHHFPCPRGQNCTAQQQFECGFFHQVDERQISEKRKNPFSSQRFQSQLIEFRWNDQMNDQKFKTHAPVSSSEGAVPFVQNDNNFVFSTGKTHILCQKGWGQCFVAVSMKSLVDAMKIIEAVTSE